MLGCLAGQTSRSMVWCGMTMGRSEGPFPLNGTMNS